MQKYISDIPDSIKRIKIDVGLSYAAPHTQNWLAHDNDLYVFGFEPNPDCIDSLQNEEIVSRPYPHHCKYNHHNYLQKNFCLIPVALGNVKEPTTMQFFRMLDDCGTSSLNEPIDTRLGSVKTISNVPVYSLKHFFDVFDWNRFPIIEFLKIDAQGSDYDILVGAGDYIQRIVYITAEPESQFYANVSHNTFENMKKYLESHGFISIQHPYTSDPTFLNKKYLHLQHDIYIYQNG